MRDGRSRRRPRPPGVSDRTCSKWVARYRADGPVGLLDRSSAPLVVANRTDERRVEAIAALRRVRFTGAEIAELLGMALSTVSGILTRIGMGKLGRLGLEPVQRYERARPGELIHIDVKKLGRIQGGCRQARHCAADSATTARRSPTPPVTGASSSAGSTCTSPSTTPPAWPTSRSWPTRRRRPRSGSFAAPSRFYASHGITVERADHRQRLALPLHRARHRLPHPRHPPPPHPALPPADQRQGLCLKISGAVRGGGEAPRACRSDSGKRHAGDRDFVCIRSAQRAVLLACVRFVDRRVAGGPAKVT